MLINKKLPTIIELKKVIDEYQKTTQFPTPTGLLNKLGISYKVWEQLQKTNSPQVQIIEAYFQHIAEHIEKLMIYQNDKFKNYKAYEFMLKKLCPTIYGDKKEPKESAASKKEKEFFESIRNDGEIKLA